MIRGALAALAFACAACGAPDGEPLPGELASDAGPGSAAAAVKCTDDGKRGAGSVCARNDDCQSDNCEKLFVCEKDRAVSCSRHRNDCAANGLPASACVEERTGTCSPTARATAFWLFELRLFDQLSRPQAWRRWLSALLAPGGPA